MEGLSWNESFWNEKFWKYVPLLRPRWWLKFYVPSALTERPVYHGLTWRRNLECQRSNPRLPAKQPRSAGGATPSGGGATPDWRRGNSRRSSIWCPGSFRYELESRVRRNFAHNMIWRGEANQILRTVRLESRGRRNLTYSMIWRVEASQILRRI